MNQVIQQKETAYAIDTIVRTPDEDFPAVSE